MKTKLLISVILLIPAITAYSQGQGGGSLITDITISSTRNVNYLIIDSSLQMQASVKPMSAVNKTITWSVSNSELATINSEGLLEGLKAGEIYVIALANDTSGIKDSMLITIYETAPIPSKLTSIEIINNSGSDSVAVSTTLQLTYLYLPESATMTGVKWSSANTSIATVNLNTGLIRGVLKGEVYIRAIATDTTSVKDSILIKVVDAIKISDINIKTASGSSVLPLNVNEQLTAEILPLNASNKSVTWISRDNTIASITNLGVVRGLKIGKVFIIATAKDGSEVKDSIELEFTKYIAVTGIEITNSGNDTIVNVNESVQVQVNVLPDSSSIKSVSYSIDKPEIASIDNTGKLTGITEGTVTVTVTSTDKVSIKDNQQFKVILPTKIMNKKINSIQIYPTIVESDLHIISDNSIEYVKIISQNGNCMLLNNQKNKEYSLNLNTLATGMYWIIIKTNNDQIVKTIFKQ